MAQITNYGKLAIRADFCESMADIFAEALDTLTTYLIENSIPFGDTPERRKMLQTCFNDWKLFKAGLL